MTVTFTTLPETPGTLSIEEITLTPEQVKTLGALSNKAYDITSDMTDGTFAYDLTLPKPANQENVEIKFAENVAGLEDADTVATSDITTETDSVSAALNHFTIFVVAGTTATTFDESAANILINEFVYNPSPGNEWVEFYNKTNDPIDISNWNLCELTGGIGAENCHEISADSILGKGFVTQELSTDLNNEGDTIILKNGSTIIDEVTYKDGTINGGQNVGIVNAGESVARTANGGNTWFKVSLPIRNYSNDPTIYVDDDGITNEEFGTSKHPFKTIQKGIDSVAVGGTVNVVAGIYNENVYLNKAVNLIGADKNTTTISNNGGAVITLNSVTGPMTISGFTIDALNTTNERGIVIQANSSNITIEQNNVRNFTENGIVISNSNSNTIKNNTINGSSSGSNAGVYIDAFGGNNSAGNIIGGTEAGDGNTILLATSGSGNLYGVLLSGTMSGNNTVRNNTINGGARAVQQDSSVSGTTTISENNVGNSLSPTWGGISLNGGSATISGNILKNAVRPIEFWGAVNVTISGNTINGSVYDGINAVSASGAVKINGNNKIYNIADNQYGIHVRSGVKNIEIDGNEIYNSYKGIGIDTGATGAKITNNNIHDNNYSAIELHEVVSVLTGNILTNASPANNRGIETYSSLTAHSNFISGFNYGAVIFAATGTFDVTNNWWGNTAGPTTFLVGKSNLNTYNQASQLEYIQANTYNDFTFAPWLNSGTDNNSEVKGFQPASGTSFAPVITTNPAGSYASIQAGINASNPDGTVNVAAGTYNESQILIDKPLTLQGAGYETTIIDGGGTSTGGLVNITASSGTVTLSGFTIQNTNNSDDRGHGINVDNGGVSSVDVKILDNAIKNVGPVGIRVNAAHSVQIERNIISSLYSSTAVIPNGIQIGYPDGAGITGTIKDNTISDCSWVNYIPALGYEDNTGGSAGILVMDTAAALEISNNDIYDNNVGIDIEAGESTKIENNNIYDNAYGIVSHNQNPSINNNKIENNSTGGVYRTAAGDPSGTLNATNNWWGNASPDFDTIISSSVDHDPWYINSGMTILSDTVTGNSVTAPSGDDDLILSLGNEGEADLPDGITDVVLNNDSDLDLSAGLVGNVVTLQSGIEGAPIVLTNSDLSGVSVSIPDGTLITGPAGWDGIITPPTSETSSGNAPAGFSVGDFVIEIGSPDGTLVFDTAVTIVLSGVTGTVGYRPSGSNVWQEITNTCTGTYANPTGAVYPGECAISNGTDTKILTFHFTSFGGLTDTENPDNVTSLKAVYRPATKDVRITWKIKNNDASEVFVYRGTSKSFGVNSGSRITKQNSNDKGYTDKDVTAGKTYYYKVVARDEAGNNSSASVIKIVIPKSGTTAAVSTSLGTEAVPAGTTLGVETGAEGQPTVTGEPQSSNSFDQGAEVTNAKPEVLGEDVQKSNQPLWSKWWFWLIILGVFSLPVWLLFKNKPTE